MLKKSCMLFFTLFILGLIINPVTAKRNNKTNKPLKFKRLNSESADRQDSISTGSDDVFSESSSQENESKEVDDEVNDLIDLFTPNTHLTMKKAKAKDFKNLTGFTFSDEEMQKFRIWPDGVVPYYIDVHSFSDKALRDRIRSFLSTVNSLTSLNFVEYPNPPPDDETRWVFFINRRGLLGCADHSVWNFTTKGVQRVVLGYDCMSNEGELPEAVLSIAGVPAQHTAPDRDEYIKVYIDNVIPEKRKLFDKLKNSEWLFHDLEYDFQSAGHYHNFKFSENGRTVIEPLVADVTIGETNVLSDMDILKIQLMYNYISKNKLLDGPECKKLFKVNEHIKNYKPYDILPKPNRKPVEYLSKALPNVDYNDDDEHQKILNSGITELKWGGTNKEIKIRQEKSVNPNQLSDTHNGIQPLKFMKVHYDPLAVLSDYTSNNEDGQRNKIEKVKLETLKAAAG